MHQNSVAAYHAELPRLSAREIEVRDWLSRNGPATDREVMRGLGYTDPNKVRPRITSLIERHQVYEVDERICSETHKRVRVVDVISMLRQRELNYGSSAT